MRGALLGPQLLLGRLRWEMGVSLTRAPATPAPGFRPLVCKMGTVIATPWNGESRPRVRASVSGAAWLERVLVTIVGRPTLPLWPLHVGLGG